MTQPKLSDRKFGVIFASVFFFITIIGWFAFDLVLRWAMVCAGTFLFFALIVPSILMPINRLWIKLTRRLHIIINFMLLASFFYFIILPFAVVMRCFGRDALRRKRSSLSSSYWQPVTRHTNETTLSDLF